MQQAISQSWTQPSAHQHLVHSGTPHAGHLESYQNHRGSSNKVHMTKNRLQRGNCMEAVLPVLENVDRKSATRATGRAWCFEVHTTKRNIAAWWPISSNIKTPNLKLDVVLLYCHILFFLRFKIRQASCRKMLQLKL